MLERLVKLVNRGVGSADSPLQKRRPGRPHINSVRCLKAMKHYVDTEPTIMAKELKEKNHRLLLNVSVCTI